MQFVQKNEIDLAFHWVPQHIKNSTDYSHQCDGLFGVLKYAYNKEKVGPLPGNFGPEKYFAIFGKTNTLLNGGVQIKNVAPPTQHVGIPSSNPH